MILDLSILSRRDQRMVSDLVNRLRPKEERKPVARFPYNPETIDKLTRSTAGNGEAAKTHWCSQCEKRVQQDEADRCKSVWCGAKIAFEMANP